MCFIVTLSQHIHWSHWFNIHIIFSSWIYLIIDTSRNSLPNCEHDTSYRWSQSNLLKVFFVLHGEVLTGFKYNFKNQLPKVFYNKKVVLKTFATFIGKHLCWSLLLIQLQACKPPTLLQRDSNTDVFIWILRNF